MNRQAQGLRNPNSQWQKPEQKKAAPVQQKPTAPVQQKPSIPTPIGKVEVKPTVLPAQKAALEKQQAQAQKVSAPAQQKPKKEEKKVQKQQFKTLTPTVQQNVKGGVNIGAEYVNEAAPKTRIVDTRTGDYLERA